MYSKIYLKRLTQEQLHLQILIPGYALGTYRTSNLRLDERL